MKTSKYQCRSYPVLLAILSLLVHLWPMASKAQSPPTYTQYNWWQFDDTNWLSGLGYTPLSVYNVVNTNAGDGNCLLLDNYSDYAFLNYNLIEADSTTNLTVDRGTILFWFAPSWSGTNAGGSGPGEWGRLITVGDPNGETDQSWWSIYTDPSGVNLYFSSQTNDGTGGTYVSAPINWTNGVWHCIALTYSSTNSTLYIDGNLASNGAAMTSLPSPDVQAYGIYIGSDWYGLTQAHGMFDDLSTYDRPLDAGTVASLSSIYTIVYGTSFVITNAPFYSNPQPGLNAITGSGLLVTLGASANCVSNTNIWGTNVTCILATNATASFKFEIQGGAALVPYDVFANAVLNSTDTNYYHWAWMGQGYQCTRYQLNNLPLGAADIILGTPLDSDFDGLTDAYEKLVSHSDPTTPNATGDGLSDLYKYLHGLSPTNAVAVPSLGSISIPTCAIP